MTSKHGSLWGAAIFVYWSLKMQQNVVKVTAWEVAQLWAAITVKLQEMAPIPGLLFASLAVKSSFIWKSLVELIKKKLSLENQTGMFYDLADTVEA